MLSAFKQLDRILRGEATRLDDLRKGKIDVEAGQFLDLLLVLGAFYGACMGSFAILGAGSGSPWQIVASAIKIPALFVLTLLVTLPSLYVFNALVGSRLTFDSMLRLITAALAVMIAVLASMGTIVAFFSVSSTSYPFMVLLNVLVMAVAGFLGLSFLLQTLHRLSVAQSREPTASPGARPGVNPHTDAGNAALPPPQPSATAVTLTERSGPGGSEEEITVVTVNPPAPPPRVPGALEPTEGHPLGRHVKTIFRIWVVVFGLVGAQMAWVLRPFVGDPDKRFTWFRPRESNFFEDVFQKIAQLFS